MSLKKRKDKLHARVEMSKKNPFFIHLASGTRLTASGLDEAKGLTPIPEFISDTDNEGYQITIENLPGALKNYTGKEEK